MKEILPWNNSKLESLLRRAIEHGVETSKVDFKEELELTAKEQKADFLKDVSAIVNTNDDKYNEYGFIICGAKPKQIIGVTKTEPDTDKLQATIDQLLKEYLSATPEAFVVGFETDDKKMWRAIVLPPSDVRPIMFFRDLLCGDESHSCKKGDWFVRRGSTTDRGLPEDLARINQKQTERLLNPLRDSIHTLQVRVERIEEQYNSALFKLVTSNTSHLSTPPEESLKEPTKETGTEPEIEDVLGLDLPTRLKQKLKTPVDRLVEDLLTEAKNIRQLLEAGDSEIPWTPQLNYPDINKKIIERIEEIVKKYQESVAIIALYDKKGVYTDALLRSVQVLAKIINIPSGITFNRIGEALRYYPLGLVLYTIFICGVNASRAELLKKVLEVPLKSSHRGDLPVHITEVFFFWYSAGDLFNNAFQQRLCAPVQARIRQIISDRIGGLIVDSVESEYFFCGEFMLALAGLDVSHRADQRLPLPGLYLYYHEAVEIIEDFLRNHPKWLESFYATPINELLDLFDRNAHQMVSPNCIGLGLHGLKTLKIYQDTLKKT